MSYGSVRSGASNDEAEAYFLTAPPPIDLAKTEEDLKEFGIKLVQKAKSLVGVGSGGPLEQHCSEHPSQAIQAETLPVPVATTQQG